MLYTHFILVLFNSIKKCVIITHSVTSLLFTVSDDDDDSDSDDDAGRPTVSAFGYDIGSTQRELFGEGDELHSEGEWTEERKN